MEGHRRSKSVRSAYVSQDAEVVKGIDGTLT